MENVSVKQQLLEEIKQAKLALNDKVKFIDLFSEHEGKQTLAELCRTVNKIEGHVLLSEFKEISFPEGMPISQPLTGRKGELVKIRPVDEKYNNKTFVGFLIGDMATSVSISVNDTHIKLKWGVSNPAIFVPELGEIIMGYESWWSQIKSESDFKGITDEDIQNVWYVKLLNKMNHGK